MNKAEFTSQVTFLYFKELDKARDFFDNILQLEKAYDPEWACVWRVSNKAFIGGVDVEQGSIEVESRGGVLISLTVNNIEDMYTRLKKHNLKDMTEIKHFDDINLDSFLFTGPEGYKFEIQQFNSKELSELF